VTNGFSIDEKFEGELVLSAITGLMNRIKKGDYLITTTKINSGGQMDESDRTSTTHNIRRQIRRISQAARNPEAIRLLSLL
jgi:hypothetical protein